MLRSLNIIELYQPRSSKNANSFASSISAEMKDGVLTVRIPKAAKAERKLITIN